MTEKEFIDTLKNTPFSREEYARLGVSEQFINRTIEGFNPKRKTASQNIVSNDPLIRLVTDYDVTKTEIGMICFESEIEETDDYYQVGKFEADFLCVSKTSKEVVVLSFDDPLNVAYHCSQNSFMFLEAIVVAAKFLEKRAIDNGNNDQANCFMADSCSELAGGKKYLDFYKVLLGCES